MSVKISLSTLKKQVEDGMKKKQLAEAYGISELQMGKVLKQAGLRIRKFHTPAFELVMDELESVPEVIEEVVEYQAVSNVVENTTEPVEAEVAVEVVPENLFSETVENKEESAIFEVFPEGVEVEEVAGEDLLLNELLN